MNKVLKFFPVLALVLAMGAAFASESGSSVKDGTLMGKRVSDDQWEVIPEGQEYSCALSSRECTAQFDANGVKIAGSSRAGTYTPVH